MNDFEDFIDDEKYTKQTTWQGGGAYGRTYSSQDDYEDEE
jgi:hypothetical protein